MADQTVDVGDHPVGVDGAERSTSMGARGVNSSITFKGSEDHRV